MQETFLIVRHAKTITGSTVVKSNGKRQISRLLSFLSKWNIDKRPLIILHSHGPRSKQTAAYNATRLSCGALDKDVRILNDHVLDIVEGEQIRSEEHTSEQQSLMRRTYAIGCLRKKTDERGVQDCRVQTNEGK